MLFLYLIFRRPRSRMQQKSATTKMKGGIMKTLSNPLLKFDTYIDMKTAMEKKAYPIVLNGCVDSQKAHFIPNLGESFPAGLY